MGPRPSQDFVLDTGLLGPDSSEVRACATEESRRRPTTGGAGLGQPGHDVRQRRTAQEVGDIQFIVERNLDATSKL